MTEQKAITTSVMTREMAQKIIADGSLKRQGITVHVFDNTLSALPPIKNEELVNKDFTIVSMCGDINTAFGAAWIVEVGNRPDLPTHSWLIGQKSVIGDNLQKLANRRGGFDKILPLWVHLGQYQSDNGQPYYSLSTPKLLTDALDTAPRPASATDIMEDLPF